MDSDGAQLRLSQRPAFLLSQDVARAARQPLPFARFS